MTVERRRPPAAFPPRTLTHDPQGKPTMEIASEEIEAEQETLDLLAER